MLSNWGRMPNSVDFTTEDMKDTNGAMYYSDNSSAISIFFYKNPFVDISLKV
jgi:hypothetical protein